MIAQETYTVPGSNGNIQEFISPAPRWCDRHLNSLLTTDPQGATQSCFLQRPSLQADGILCNPAQTILQGLQ